MTTSDRLPSHPTNKRAQQLFCHHELTHAVTHTVTHNDTLSDTCSETHSRIGPRCWSNDSTDVSTFKASEVRCHTAAPGLTKQRTATGAKKAAIVPPLTLNQHLMTTEDRSQQYVGQLRHSWMAEERQCALCVEYTNVMNKVQDRITYRL